VAKGGRGGGGGGGQSVSVRGVQAGCEDIARAKRTLCDLKCDNLNPTKTFMPKCFFTYRSVYILPRAALLNDPLPMILS